MNEKGIPYSDDIACAAWRLKHHSKGFKNIYTVQMSYHNDFDRKKVKVIEMSYGQYQLAMDRFNIEISSMSDYQPESWLIDSIKMFSTTYSGTKKVCQDMLKVVKFGTKRCAENYPSNGSRNRIGEVML